MLTIEEVEKIEKLSKLSLSDDERNEMLYHLNGVFEYMEMINEVDLKDIEPLFNIHDYDNVLREDVVNNSLKKEDFLNDSPIKDTDFIVVPKIVD